MTKTSKTVIFFGNERLATGVHTDTPVLKSLIAADYHVAAVVSNYERGKSRNSRDLEIAEVAAAHNIPLLLPQKLKDVADQLCSYQAIAGVLVAYGKIIPQSIIDIFPRGIINIHPSLLPRHRGPTPVESAILAGDSLTGVSIMALAKEMDAGPIYAQSEHSLTGTETKQELADTLLAIGDSMLQAVLPGILEGAIVGVPQDPQAATYDKLITKDDGRIDWSKPAVQLEREIRAFSTWPNSRTVLANKELVITRAHTVAGSREAGKTYVDQKQLCVGTADGILVIDTLKPAGKPEMAAQAFLSGYGKAL